MVRTTILPSHVRRNISDGVRALKAYHQVVDEGSVRINGCWVMYPNRTILISAMALLSQQAHGGTVRVFRSW